MSDPVLPMVVQRALIGASINGRPFLAHFLTPEQAEQEARDQFADRNGFVRTTHNGSTIQGATRDHG